MKNKILAGALLGIVFWSGCMSGKKTVKEGLVAEPAAATAGSSMSSSQAAGAVSGEPRFMKFHYTLTDKDGKVLDSSSGREPLPVIEGAGQIIPGLESEIFKMKAGEKKKIQVPAALAYGPVQDALKIKVQRSELPPEALRLGARLSTGQPFSPEFTVVAINGEEVTLDGNHPLAGQDLTFDVEIVELRPASKEEVGQSRAY